MGKAQANIWVWIEIEENQIQKVSFELLAIGKVLARKRGCLLTAIIIASQAEEAVKGLSKRGIDQIIIVDDAVYSSYSTDAYAITMTRLIGKYQPETLLIGATDIGRDLAPRVACACKTGLTADCTGIDIDEESGCVVWTRPAYGEKLMARIICKNARPQMGTVRPGVFGAGEFSCKASRFHDLHKKPEIIREEAKVCKEEIHTRLVKRIQEVTEDIKLEEAEVIVSVGKGIGSAENLERVEKFAEKIGGTLACSRGLVEEGWLPPYYQVGQSGKTVSPKIYFAIGISGAIQHLAGISRAKKVIAINMDPQADIFKRADYGIVGDYKEILPLLGDRLRKDGMETFA